MPQPISQYKEYTAEQLEELNSNFLIDSWSYSKVTQFARHEKAFEMMYIYGERSKSSATTVAGQAYHYALEYFFQNLIDGTELSQPELEILAFNYIDEMLNDEWKLQKTTPDVETAKIVATKTVNKLLDNFYKEKSAYLDDVEEVLFSEMYLREFITVDGVDIPMPVAVKIDTAFRLKNGKIVLVDHKSKSSYTNENEIHLASGKQAITYVNTFETRTGLTVDEVWFAENKHSQNKDKSAQIQIFKITIDDNTRKLYEALLYEGLKRMLVAVADPDYVYLINDSDNFVDRAEIYDFWTKTLIAEIGDFNIPEAKREMVNKRLKKIRDTSLVTANPKIIKDFKKQAAQFIQYDISMTDLTTDQKIEHTLRKFNILVNVAHILEGYSSNTYLLEVSAGVKITSIQTHKLDIANALNVSNVRIPKDLKVYEGKSYVAIETSKKRERDLLWSKKELQGMRVPIGKDNLNTTIVWDLANHSTPHVLIGGATGSGKSISLISTIEFVKLIPDVESIIILDPKFEFTKYNRDKKVEVYNDIIDIENKIKEMVDEMNNLVREGKRKLTVVIFDEFADAVANARKGRELDVYEDQVVGYYKQTAADQQMGLKPQEKKKKVKVGELKPLEENLRILLQKGRSIGYRIISATQRASTKVISGDAKANYPVQICFRVPKEIDSRVMIDEPGAEGLAGAGDFLMKSPEYLDTIRGQAYFKK